MSDGSRVAAAPAPASSLPAAFWAALEAGVSALLSALSAFGIARIVGPAEIGIAAAALAPHILLWIATNAIFADALVQRATLSEAEAASALRAGGLAGLLTALIQAASGPLLAALFGDPRLAAMALVLALPLPLVGLGGAMQGVLNRRRAFRALAGRAVLGQGAGTALGLVLAWHGGGAWAPVGQQAATSAIGALVLLARSGRLPRGPWQGRAVRALLRTGLPLTASTLALQARYRVFALLIGATAGPAVLGQVHLAFRLVDTLRDLASTALWRLSLPVMAERQHDLAGLRAAVDAGTRRTAFPMLGGCMALALAAQPLVALLLGPHWHGAAAAALPLCAVAAWQFMSFAGGVAAVARGYAWAALGINLLAMGAAALAVMVLHPHSAPGAALAWGVAAGAVAPFGQMVTAHALGWPPARALRAALPALALALAAGGLAWSGAALAGRVLGEEATLRLGLRLGLFAAVYGPAAWGMWREGARGT